jgi:predicted Zn-dependent protease
VPAQAAGRHARRVALAPLLLLAAIACATSPLGRSQLMLFSDTEMAAMGVAAYDQLKSELPESTNEAQIRYVRCVADAITAELAPEQGPGQWEVTLFEDPTANAFALPGGKIGVHTGLLAVATNQDQLAAVIGHEVAHVLAGHANERVSTQFATQTGMQIAQTLAGGMGPAEQQLMALLGVGAQVGVLLPFSRAQEKEADLLGLDLMAPAGFDPRASVSLWENMSASGGEQPPELLSTHPANASRIYALRGRIPQVMPAYEKAVAAGKRPRCS